MQMIDFKTIIKDFPILNRIINENKLIYFGFFKKSNRCLIDLFS